MPRGRPKRKVVRVVKPNAPITPSEVENVIRDDNNPDNVITSNTPKIIGGTEE